MRPSHIVEIKVPRERAFEVAHALVGVQVDFLILHAAPQPLDEHVVHPAPLAIHAHPHCFGQQWRGEIVGGELASLVGVEDFGCTKACHSVLERFHAKCRVHDVAQAPSEHLATVEVQNRHQVGKALGHRHIGDVGGPDLVRPLDEDIAQQVRIDLVTLGRNRGSFFAIDRLDAHQAHEGGHVKAADLNARTQEHANEPPGPEEWVDKMQFVDTAHERQIGRGYWLGPVIHARAAKIEQFALAHDRHLALSVDQRFALGLPNLPSAPDKKSRSMVISPTLACRSRIRSSASSAAGLPFSKISPACSRSCFRQVAIWVACKLWREASTARVASPFNASSAIRALNLGEWFLRERFMVAAPLSRHRCRYDRAVHPLKQTRFRVQKNATISVRWGLGGSLRESWSLSNYL